ncbi:hypothetical protein J8F10_10630 [Gemmata sp. G18]|uniref:Uncharacterized protein n=1 Tax=Gemmata palustris TaxID=2822762 RepID=A0ABS5BQL7_9BACT|nr:hypothetical protein [Gemmata palustris]MBP3955737.1 hypothetical protein [Gemmata palustris]
MTRPAVVPLSTHAEIGRRYRSGSGTAEKTLCHVPRLVTRPDRPVSATMRALLVGFNPPGAARSSNDYCRVVVAPAPAERNGFLVGGRVP